ncbi:MAG TPA: M28 family metallopeptidase [Roseateles sp.]|nr:M28 family metallopeptidase [Roseateles sp.]
MLPILLAACGLAAAQQTPLDAEISKMLGEVSAARIEQRIKALVGFHTRHTLSETESQTRGIGAARRWIQRELQACSQATGGRLQVTMDEFVEPAGNRLPRPATLVNVVATLPGSSAASKDRLLVVSGHYDSRNSDVMDATGQAPGANDDASGVAAVMELACVMAGRSFDATLVYMAVPGEEQGLLGAAHWARQARRQGLNIEAMITNDIVGSSRGDAGQVDKQQLRLFADGYDPLLRLLVQARSNQPVQPDAEQQAVAAARDQLQQLALAGGAEDLPTHQLGRHLKAAGERYLPGFKVNLIQRRDRYLRGGDHLPFLERGYAAVRFTEPFEDFAHQHQNVRTENGVVYGDLPEFVDFSYVADVARINLAGLASLARAPAPPAGVKLETSQLTNDSALRWEAGSDPAIAGYRVVWRHPESPTWQQARDVGLVTRALLPGLSKDNVVFGVQALSKGGHASLASFPLPAR